MRSSTSGIDEARPPARPPGDRTLRTGWRVDVAFEPAASDGPSSSMSSWCTAQSRARGRMVNAWNRTNAWPRSTCPGPPRRSTRGSDAGSGSAIRARTSRSCTWCPAGALNGSSTWRRRSCRRRCVPPVPAAHEARERRDRLGVQRRSALADPRGRVLREGYRRPADPRRAGPVRQRARTETPLFEHLERALSRHDGPARPPRPAVDRPCDWNDCLNLNAFSRSPASRSRPCPPRGRGGPSRCSSRGSRPGRGGARVARGTPRIAGDAVRIRSERGRMVQAIRTTAGRRWFRRAYDFFGRPVGSAADEEGGSGSSRMASA